MKYSLISFRYLLLILILAVGCRINEEVNWNKFPTITLENVTHLAPIEKLDEREIKSLTFSSNAQVLVIAGNKRVALWDVIKKNKIKEWQLKTQVFSIAISPNGELLCIVSNNIQLWDIKTFQQIATIESFEYITTVAFSPDGKLLTAGFVGWAGGEEQGIGLWGGVLLWNTNFYQKLGMLRCQSGVHSIVFSPDGELLAVATYEIRKSDLQSVAPGGIELWDIKKKTRLVRLNQQDKKEGVKLIAFSPLGNLIASGESNITRLWDVKNHQQIDTIVGKNSSLSFSSDGQLLAIGGNGIWSVSEKKRLVELPKKSIACFSSNGKILAVGLKDRIELWSVKQ